MAKQRYGHQHRALREQLRPAVEAGLVFCSRPECGERILPGQKWDLGHVDGQPWRYSGPEHARCNRGTALKDRVTSPWYRPDPVVNSERW